jgi:hypothetical protein
MCRNEKTGIEKKTQQNKFSPIKFKFCQPNSHFCSQLSSLVSRSKMGRKSRKVKGLDTRRRMKLRDRKGDIPGNQEVITLSFVFRLP